MKKILNFIKKHRLWLTIAVALLAILIATPTFASMGHSGGGGHISAGGSGGHISSHSASEGSDAPLPLWENILNISIVGLGFIIVIIAGSPPA